MWLLLLSAMLPIAAEPSAVSAWQPTCLEGETAHIKSPMNIRESPSTSSPVVAGAQTGDTFAVIQKTVGAKYCWLKISLGWLAVTGRVRVTFPNRFLDTGSTAPTTTAPSDIDNCCFVDRQCTTEQEWTDGYWAFQNRQCGAQPQFSGANLSRPRIEGSEAFINVMNESLNIIERKAPALYQYIVSATRVIEEREEEPGTNDCNLGFAVVGTGRTSLGSCVKDLYLHNKDLHLPKPLYAYHAAYLAHEACHHHGDDWITGEFVHETCHIAGYDAVDAMSA